MAKDDPVAKARKAAKAKDKKRAKESREKARDAKAVKSDSRGLEASVRRLEESERAGNITEDQKVDLARLRKELEHVRKAKADFVASHPDSKNQVYHIKERSQGPSMAVKETKKLFGKNGLPLRPERSIYYDPVYNPTGMPPPGQPYKERDPTPDPDATLDVPEAAASSEESDEDSDDDDDIIMPEGPPPGAGDEDSDEDSDGIIMPEGPPPPKPGQAASSARPTAASIISAPPSISAPPQLSAASGSAATPAPAAASSSAQTPVVAGPQAFAAAPTPRPAPSTTITAAPQLRDLKKEATTFVPAALKRKRAAPQPSAASGPTRPIQAAPSVDISAKRARVDEEEEQEYEPLEGFD